jgi:hypothetical protein
VVDGAEQFLRRTDRRNQQQIGQRLQWTHPRPQYRHLPRRRSQYAYVTAARATAQSRTGIDGIAEVVEQLLAYAQGGPPAPAARARGPR